MVKAQAYFIGFLSGFINDLMPAALTFIIKERTLALRPVIERQTGAIHGSV
jgi:hypothetical protein